VNFIALRSAERMPWANGGGFKRNLLKTAHVQISVAEITQDGPFSMLSDQQRFFAVLSGEGVILGAHECALTKESAVYEFPGEQAPACRLIQGPTEDLNLMVQRSTTRGALRREHVSSAGHTTDFPAGKGILAAYLCGPATIYSPCTQTPVQIHEAGLLWQEATVSPAQWRVQPMGDAAALTIYLIEGLDL
jgi:environmental stress-induced protein Ves